MALLDMGMEGDVLLKRDQPFPESPAEVTSLSLAPTGWLWTPLGPGWNSHSVPHSLTVVTQGPIYVCTRNDALAG